MRYRQPDGVVKALGATTTVAAGINTPADTVIVAEQEFKGEDGGPFTVAEYKNMAGRAGRLGIRDRGRSIIYAETALQREQLFARYVKGTLEPLRSSFNPKDLDTWMIRLLAQVDSVPAADVINLLCKSYGGYLENRGNPKWRFDIAERLQEMLRQMLALGLAEEELGNIRLTLLGRACGTSTLSFGSAMRLVELIKDAGARSLTPTLLVSLLQALAELDRIYTPLFSRSLGREAAWPQRVGGIFGMDAVRTLQRFAPNNAGYLARCKRACVISDWIKGVSVEEIERVFTTNNYVAPFNYGDIRNIVDTTRFHLRSARQIVSLLLTSTPEFEQDIDNLLQQLEAGLPADTLDLLMLPVALHRGDYLALRSADVKTRDQVWKMTSEQLESLLGRGVSKQLAALRPRLVEEKDAVSDGAA